jgi:uncharacterized LabA/DUF88 family protein
MNGPAGSNDKALRTSVFVDGDYFDVTTRRQLQINVNYHQFANALYQHFGKDANLYLFQSIIPNRQNRVEAEEELRKAGFKVKTSPLYKGRTTIKTNIDVIIAAEILGNSRSYDRAILVSGDDDFAPVVGALKSLRKQAIVAGIPLGGGRQLRSRAHGFIDIGEILSGKFEGLPPDLESDERIAALRVRYFAKGYQLEARAEMRRIISMAADRVWLADRYVTADVIRLLNSANPGVRLRIWAEKDRENAQAEARRIKNGGRQIYLYYVGKDLHGRHLIIDDMVWHLGHSLKDLGYSDAVIQPLDDPTAVTALESRLNHLGGHSVI